MNLTVDLPPHLEHRLEEEAAQQGMAVDALVLALLEERFGSRSAGDDRASWLRLVEIGDRMPQDVRDAFAPDSSENVDHYLYGAPRRSG